MKHTPLPLVACGLLVSAPCLAASAPQIQVPPSERRGPFSGLAAGLSRPSGAGGELQLKQPGDQTTAPSSWTPVSWAPFEPDYRLDEMFPDDHEDVRIDAHSTGNAVLPPFNSSGWLDMQSAQGGWLGVFVSVRAGAEGAPESVLAQRLAAGQGIGADIVGHYVAQSTGISSSVVGKTFLELGAEHVGLSTGDEIDAWDFALGVRAFTPTLTRQLFFTNIDEYYFSLTPWSAAQLTAWAVDPADPEGPRLNAHAASIYRIRWDGLTWSEPVEYVSYSALGFTETNDDVDALAVDRLRGRLLLSTQYSLQRSQILAYELGMSATVTLHDAAGVPIEVLLGLRVDIPSGSVGSPQDVDDVDALCDIDPEGGTGIDNSVGIPTGPAFALPFPTDDLSLSVTRSVTVPYGGGLLYVEATGPGAQPGAYTLLVSPDYRYATQFGSVPTWFAFPFETSSSSGLGARSVIPIPGGVYQPGWGFCAVYGYSAPPAGTPLLAISPAVELSLVE